MNRLVTAGKCKEWRANLYEITALLSTWQRNMAMNVLPERRDVFGKLTANVRKRWRTTKCAGPRTGPGEGLTYPEELLVKCTRLNVRRGELYLRVVSAHTTANVCKRFHPEDFADGVDFCRPLVRTFCFVG